MAVCAIYVWYGTVFGRGIMGRRKKKNENEKRIRKQKKWKNKNTKKTCGKGTKKKLVYMIYTTFLGGPLPHAVNVGFAGWDGMGWDGGMGWGGAPRRKLSLAFRSVRKSKKGIFCSFIFFSFFLFSFFFFFFFFALFGCGE